MAQNQPRLDTWKQIAEYLKKDVRTVIRWEAERGLPVHRMPGQKRSSVYAWVSEIDAWRNNSGLGRSSLDGNGREAALLVAPAAIKVRLRGVWLAMVAVPALSVVAGLLAFGPRPQHPRLGQRVQVTSDGLDRSRLLVGSASLYFSTQSERNTIGSLGFRGSEARLLYSSDHYPCLADVSADGSKLLITERETETSVALRIIPGSGGVPRTVVPSVRTGVWSPDGRSLAYVRGATLYLAHSNGAEPHRLVSVPLFPENMRWSPDGKRIVLSCSNSKLGAQSQLWEVSVDGKSIRRFEPGWNHADQDAESDGDWTPDGKYFVFAADHNGTHALWAVRQGTGWFDWTDRGPFQLTASLYTITHPTFSKDGKKLFAIVDEPERGELMRYDPREGRFRAYLDRMGLGFSGAHVSFSPDGKHLAYVSYPRMELWTMSVDGSSRQELADRAFLPQWSPDGRRIAFMSDANTTKTAKIYIISADGGGLEQPVPSPEWQGVATWTPDGRSLIFGDNAPTQISSACTLHRFDFESGAVTDLPGTRGLWTARTCPTGRYVAALTHDNHALVLYDLRAATWTTLASFPDSLIGDNPTWSRDGKFIYFDAPGSANPAIYRTSIATKQMERVASLKGVQRQLSGGQIGLWIGLTPDNRPLIFRAIQSNDIYSWDWIAPSQK